MSFVLEWMKGTNLSVCGVILLKWGLDDKNVKMWLGLNWLQAIVQWQFSGTETRTPQNYRSLYWLHHYFCLSTSAQGVS
jgi:hypothetical protein